MASGASEAPRTHSLVAEFRYPERNRRGPLVINPLLPNRESPVSDLASRPARKDGEKTRFSPYRIVLRSINAAAQCLLDRWRPVPSRQDATGNSSSTVVLAFTMPASGQRLTLRTPLLSLGRFQ